MILYKGRRAKGNLSFAHFYTYKVLILQLRIPQMTRRKLSSIFLVGLS